ncbi:hypothetical protein GCM10023085_58000 [Actinomadura viridis]
MRSYRPLDHRTRLGAWWAARDMRRTLRHFHGLEVRVTRVSVDEVRAEAMETARLLAEEAAARDE